MNGNIEFVRWNMVRILCGRCKFLNGVCLGDMDAERRNLLLGHYSPAEFGGVYLCPALLR